MLYIEEHGVRGCWIVSHNVPRHLLYIEEHGVRCAAASSAWPCRSRVESAPRRRLRLGSSVKWWMLMTNKGSSDDDTRHVRSWAWNARIAIWRGRHTKVARGRCAWRGGLEAGQQQVEPLRLLLS